MKTNQSIGCSTFPCAGVNHECYAVPGIDIDPEKVSIVMISEGASASLADTYYAGGESLFDRTTTLVFNEAGIKVSSIQDILDLGFYLTTAVKCGKVGPNIESRTIKECSNILEKELAQFPNVKALMLMGDVAIKALNEIARRAGEPRIIPAIPTYKLRGQEFFFRGKRVFPSYLQAGPSFFIEKGKHLVIGEHIVAAMKWSAEKN